MGKPKQKWTLREALVQVAPLEEQDEFRRLDGVWRGSPWAWSPGSPPSKADLERQHFLSLDQRLSQELLNQLQRGEWASEWIDPVQGLTRIRREAWEVLEPDFKESTATAAGHTFVGIRVWPVRTVRPSIRAEAECRKWLRRLVSEGYQPPTKDVLLDQAMTLFTDLSERGFGRCWDEEAPDSWKERGRRPRRTGAQQA